MNNKEFEQHYRAEINTLDSYAKQVISDSNEFLVRFESSSKEGLKVDEIMSACFEVERLITEYQELKGYI